jgi:hypothetical protein
MVWSILERCRSTGIRLWAENGQVRFRAPAGAMSPWLKADLIGFKPELLAYFADPPSQPDAWSRWRARRDELEADGQPPREAARLAYLELLGPELDAEDAAHWQRQLAERPTLARHRAERLACHQAAARKLPAVEQI